MLYCIVFASSSLYVCPFESYESYYVFFSHVENLTLFSYLLMRGRCKHRCHYSATIISDFTRFSFLCNSQVFFFSFGFYVVVNMCCVISIRVTVLRCVSPAIGLSSVPFFFVSTF